MQLTVSNLAREFPNAGQPLVILRDVSFALTDGEILAITGESGCGKSTLLRLVAGLDRPTSGSIVLDGVSVHSASDRELTQYRSRTVGLVFQFHYLLRDFTALENVMLPAYVRGESRESATERAAQLLHEVGLDDRAHHLPAQLSGGERQRVAVARALINDPTLILADEPTGNLDERNSEVVAHLLFEIVKRHDKSMLLVTHDSRLAAQASRVVRLEGGVLSTLR